MEQSSTSPFDRLKHPKSIYDRLVRRFNGDTSAMPTRGSVQIYQDQYEHLMGLIKANWPLYLAMNRQVKFRFVQRKHRLSYSLIGRVHRALAENLRDMIEFRIALIGHELGHGYTDIASSISEVSAMDVPDIGVDGLYKLGSGGEARASKLCFALDVAYMSDYEAATDSMADLLIRTKARPGLGIVFKVNNKRMIDDLRAQSPQTQMRASYSILMVTQEGFENDRKTRPYISISSHKGLKFRDKAGRHCDGALRIPMRDMIGPNHLRSIDESDPVNAAILEREVVIAHEELNRCLDSAERTPPLQRGSSNQEFPAILG